ncbi:hypothetical protein TorRG33x02_191120, partial [Trema orientale]
MSYKRPWKFISSYLENFQKHIRCKVGSSLKIRFWEDLWVGDYTFADRFPLLYHLLDSKNTSIAALRTSENYIISWSFSWNLGSFRNLNERETERVSSLISILDLVRCREEENDTRIWQLDRFGQFSCK